MARVRWCRPPVYIHSCRSLVLLVDDLLDSRWTVTVVATALLEASSGPASPDQLAKSVHDWGGAL